MQYLFYSNDIGYISRTQTDLGVLRNPARLWNE